MLNQSEPPVAEKVAVKPPIISNLDTLSMLSRMYMSTITNGVLAPRLRSDVMEQMRLGRLSVLKHLLESDPQTTMHALEHGFIRNQREIRMSGILQQPLDKTEAEIIDKIRLGMSQGIKAPYFLNLLAISHLYFQPFELPFVPDGLDKIDGDIAITQLYLSYFMTESTIVNRDDGQKIADQLICIMDWCSQQISNATSRGAVEFTRWIANIILPNIGALNVNPMIYTNINCIAVSQARGRLIKSLNDFQEWIDKKPVPKFDRKPVSSKGRKVRIGYLIRSLGQGPDTQVILAEIGEFDPEKVEVFIYSRDVHDNSFQHNAAFYRRFYNKIAEVRSIAHRPTREVIEKIRQDELDIFIAHDATSYSFGQFDLLSGHRIAPVQLYLNRLMSISSGLDSFDYYVAARTPPQNFTALTLQTTEQVRQVPGALIAYDRANQIAPSTVISRETLGIGQNDIVLLCGAAASKIGPICCELFVRILAELPQAKLVLASFNPAWGGLYTQPMLEVRLSNTLRKYGVKRDRIIMIGELSPQDVPQLTSLADIYLNQTPLGGATWLTKCLSQGLPPVVMDTTLLNGIGDQSLVRGAGFEELIAKDENDYVRLAVELASNKEKRDAIRERIIAARNNMPHNDLVTFSKQMQDFYISLNDEMAEKAAATL